MTLPDLLGVLGGAPKRARCMFGWGSGVPAVELKHYDPPRPARGTRSRGASLDGVRVVEFRRWS